MTISHIVRDITHSNDAVCNFIKSKIKVNKRKCTKKATHESPTKAEAITCEAHKGIPSARKIESDVGGPVYVCRTIQTFRNVPMLKYRKVIKDPKLLPRRPKVRMNLGRAHIVKEEELGNLVIFSDKNAQYRGADELNLYGHNIHKEMR